LGEDLGEPRPVHRLAIDQLGRDGVSAARWVRNSPLAVDGVLEELRDGGVDPARDRFGYLRPVDTCIPKY
jgi:hypothetical protein